MALDSIEEEKDADETQITTTTAPVQATEFLADNFDKFYFQNNKKLKLNKGEKRALKFAIQKGASVDEIDDLRGYLEKQMEDSKRMPHAPILGGGDPIKYSKHGNRGVMKVADYT